jgi:FHA domain-containing protein
MSKPFPRGDHTELEAAATTPRASVEKMHTQTAPESQRGGTLERPSVVTSLLLYGTDSLWLTPPSVKQITVGSEVGLGIVLPSVHVSAKHCRLDRKREQLWVIDLGSKNGTFFEGVRRRSFALSPGKVFIVGTRAHRFVALNDVMRMSYPALVDILGAENEHAIGGANDPPSPSDLIVTATGGAHLVITGEPHCGQDRLARVIHDISLYCERPFVELRSADIPKDRKPQADLIKQVARATLVLHVDPDDKPLSEAFVSPLFKARHQVRVIAVARDLEVADRVLGPRYCRQLKELWLRPLASRPEAIDRLFNRALEERSSPLKMAYLTPQNQDALRSYDWPENFESVREAAIRLTAIYRLGNPHQAALALEMASSSLYKWYRHELKLSTPLSHRLRKPEVAE